MGRFGPPTFGDAQLAEKPVALEERQWGYILNAPGRTYAGMNLIQCLSLFVAAYLLAFPLSWMIPQLAGFVASQSLLLGVTAAVVVALLSLPFVWFATRGTKAYVHVNLHRNEMREVVPNLIGKPTVLNSVSFKDIGGVRIDHGAAGDRAVLLLCEGGRWRRIAMLDGERHRLTRLREKLANDVLSDQMSLPEAPSHPPKTHS